MHHEHAGMNEAAARLYLEISAQQRAQGSVPSVVLMLRNALACIGKQDETLELQRPELGLQIRVGGTSLLTLFCCCKFDIT